MRKTIVDDGAETRLPLKRVVLLGGERAERDVGNSKTVGELQPMTEEEENERK